MKYEKHIDFFMWHHWLHQKLKNTILPDFIQRHAKQVEFLFFVTKIVKWKQKKRKNIATSFVKINRNRKYFESVLNSNGLIKAFNNAFLSVKINEALLIDNPILDVK